MRLSLYGKFYEQQPVFPGTDVSGDPGLWRMADRTRKMEAADLAMYALYIGIFIAIQILVELTE